MQTREAKLRELFDELDTNNIRYVIPWGWENLPKDINGTDLDMIVDYAHIKILSDLLKKLGFVISKHPYPSYQNCMGIHLLAHSELFDIDIWDHFCSSTSDKINRQILWSGEDITFERTLIENEGFIMYIPKLIREYIILKHRQKFDKNNLLWKSERIRQIESDLKTTQNVFFSGKSQPEVK